MEFCKAGADSRACVGQAGFIGVHMTGTNWCVTPGLRGRLACMGRLHVAWPHLSLYVVVRRAAGTADRGMVRKARL